MQENIGQRRITSVDVNVLAKTPTVRAFMLRVIDHHRDPLTGHVFASTLADVAAKAFDLHFDDGVTIPRALLEVAAQVIALENACARAQRCPARERGALPHTRQEE